MVHPPGDHGHAGVRRGRPSTARRARSARSTAARPRPPCRRPQVRRTRARPACRARRPPSRWPGRSSEVAAGRGCLRGRPAIDDEVVDTVRARWCAHIDLLGRHGLHRMYVARDRKASRTPKGCASAMASWPSAYSRAHAGSRCGRTPRGVCSSSSAPRTSSAVRGVEIRFGRWFTPQHGLDLDDHGATSSSLSPASSRR